MAPLFIDINKRNYTFAKLLLLFSTCFLLCVNSFSQGEANFWYFGVKAGLDFNTAAPVAITNGQLNTREGCASISDPSGNLLFYTDGLIVWDKTHTPMPNGTGLFGNSSATQAAIIIQKPGSTTIYYIFTVDYALNGIRYSEVDITLNSGKGDVTINKNILLNTSTSEKITGVRHCNNKDVWVVTHDYNSNTFRTYLVTAAGINTTPILSSTGTIVNNSFASIGQLKASPDGKKLAAAIYGLSRIELYDFNNTTGVVSNPLLLSTLGTAYYGMEFSPDGTKLYGSMFNNVGDIYQFNLCAGSNTAIANSGVLIGNSWGVASLQLGPDKKIYTAKESSTWLGVINNPNALGIACNYLDNGISLAGRTSQLGLPNFIPYFFKPPPPPFTESVNCLESVFKAPEVNTSNCSGANNAISSVVWNFGDIASAANNISTNNNPTHTFTSAGSYDVYLVLNYACGSDTIRKTIAVNSCTCTLSAQFTKGTATCSNCGCQEWVLVNGVNGTPPYTYQWPDGYDKRYKNKLCPGNYTVKVTDKSGCSVDVNITAP